MKKALLLVALGTACSLMASALTINNTSFPAMQPKSAAGVTLNTFAKVQKAPAKAAATSAAELAGAYIEQMTCYTKDPAKAGGSVTIKHLTGDSIEIDNLWNSGSTVIAICNFEKGTITIPSQVVATNATYGDLTICTPVVTSTGLTFDYTTPISGTIGDGCIDLGAYVVALGGDWEGHYMGNICHNTHITKANGKMDVTYYSGMEPVSWNVYLQYNANRDTLTVSNFGNHGLDVAVPIKGDSVAVPTQMVWDVDTAGTSTYTLDFYTCTVDWATNKLSQTTPIAGTFANDTVKLGQWTAFSFYRRYQIYVPLGAFDDATIYFTEKPAPALKGDVNGDGVVNSSDLAALVTMILNESTDTKGDVNGDGQVDASDISALTIIILG